jgi:ketosteroid isomerase-like protein
MHPLGEEGQVPQQPSAEITALIEAAVSAFNRKDSVSFKSIFADHVVIVDGFAPYRWVGPDAGDRWWSDVETWGTNGGVASEKLDIDGVHCCEVSGARAYAAFSATLTITLKKGDVIIRPGTLVYTYAKLGDAWKADAQAWGRLS